MCGLVVLLDLEFLVLFIGKGLKGLNVVESVCLLLDVYGFLWCLMDLDVNMFKKLLVFGFVSVCRLIVVFELVSCYFFV